jgi:hypothetical protein
MWKTVPKSPTTDGSFASSYSSSASSQSSSWFGGQRKKQLNNSLAPSTSPTGKAMLWSREDVPSAVSQSPTHAGITPPLGSLEVSQEERQSDLRRTKPLEELLADDTPDSQARRFAVEHGVPPYIVPPDALVAWSQTQTDRGIEVHLELDKQRSRNVEIWTVTWEKHVSGVIYKHGEFGDIRGVSAAASFLKGVRVRASKFVCTSLDGASSMTITAKPPMLPSFPVSVSTAFVLTRKGAGLRWLPACTDGRRSEDERIRRLSGVFAACQVASGAG